MPGSSSGSVQPPSLVQIRYVAHANTSLLYHPPQDSLNHCTLEGLVHVRLRDTHHSNVVYPQLALLRGHFPHNLINAFSVSNIDQVNHLYNFLVHEPEFPLLQQNSSLFFLRYINIHNIIIHDMSQYILASDQE